MKKRKIAKRFVKSKNNVLLLIALILIASVFLASLLRIPFSINAKEKITITEFLMPNENSMPYNIIEGTDGNLWFTEFDLNKIGRITPHGKITEFTIPTEFGLPVDITSGADGNMWFTETVGNKIGRITPNGEITEFVVPTHDSRPYGITRGQDGNIWFTEFQANKIGRITPSGSITEFVIPTEFSQPYDITAGPDGNLWFTENNVNKIGKITSTGEITEFVIPTSGSDPFGITSGPDGNLWFTSCEANHIGRITPSGTITEFSIPTDNSGSQCFGIASGPDGNVWFTEFGFNNIGRITPNGTITEFMVPTQDSSPFGITTGPDGNVWFTEYSENKIGRVNLPSDKGPERDVELLSPFNHGVKWTVFNGYLDNRDQSKDGCGVGENALDHCRNQLFGLDMVPDQQNDTDILTPGNGKVTFRGKLPEENCIGVRITLDNGLNMNVCHFASFNVSQGDRVLRGKLLGIRSSPHVHLSLDDRYRIGTLCPRQERCFLPVPFDGEHTLEGMSLPPDPNGETVTIPYPLCDQRKINCKFKVGFQQYQGLKGTSSNIAIP